MPIVYSTVDFVSPTPADGNFTFGHPVEIAVDVNNSDLSTFSLNWNGTSFNVYDDTILVMMAFNNYSSLGENDTHVYDASIYENNGTVYGATLTSTPETTGYSFDGVDDYINITHNPSIALNNSFTIGFTVKVNELPDYQERAIISKGINGSNLTFWIGTYHNDIRMKWDDIDGGTSSHTIGNLNVGEWNHIGVIFNDTDNRLLIYKNGELWRNDSEGDTPKFNTENIQIGTDSDGQYFNGTIDCLRIYNSSMPDDIVDLQCDCLLVKEDPQNWSFIFNKSDAAGTYTYSVSDDENSTETRTITSGYCGYNGLGDWSIDYPLSCENENFPILDGHDIDFGGSESNERISYILFDNVTIYATDLKNSYVDFQSSVDSLIINNSNLSGFNNLQSWQSFMTIENTVFDYIDDNFIIENGTFTMKNVEIINPHTSAPLQIQSGKDILIDNLSLYSNSSRTSDGIIIGQTYTPDNSILRENIKIINSYITASDEVIVMPDNFKNILFENITFADSDPSDTDNFNALFYMENNITNVTIKNISYEGNSLQSMIKAIKDPSDPSDYPDGITIYDSYFNGSGRIDDEDDYAMACFYGDAPTTLNIYNSTIHCRDRRILNWTDGTVNSWNSTILGELGYSNGVFNEYWMFDIISLYLGVPAPSMTVNISNIGGSTWARSTDANGRTTPEFMLERTVTDGTDDFQGYYFASVYNSTHSGTNSTFLYGTETLTVHLDNESMPVGNQAPGISLQLISNGLTNMAIDAEATYTDPEGVQGYVSLTWKKNGISMSSYDVQGSLAIGETLTSRIPRDSLSAGDTWTVTATANDGHTTIQEVDSVTIQQYISPGLGSGGSSGGTRGSTALWGISFADDIDPMTVVLIMTTDGLKIQENTVAALQGFTLVEGEYIFNFQVNGKTISRQIVINNPTKITLKEHDLKQGFTFFTSIIQWIEKVLNYRVQINIPFI